MRLSSMAKNWATELIERLKSQKTLPEQQELIDILFEKAIKNKVDKMELVILLRAERAKERSKAAESSAFKLLGARKDGRAEGKKSSAHRAGFL